MLTQIDSEAALQQQQSSNMHKDSLLKLQCNTLKTKINGMAIDYSPS